ncbi:putative TetR-family transcriptional regulator [Actinomycetospora sp. NBRC 106375]|uniref:TetR/AcrR family transcriptional regulator n=1 Tax=Actinomycetospora sp. NBRC 106375 TaxID=3032207 RepID=UPI0024A52FA2|nr:TetR/AcrR family transcriptional regulator [Actinomycetospora sp. NBRC 106375]GLZ50185.1 putative TetR-family transcriptional regulator [Actinomycetospora sp. NBRC 106375]
MVTRAFQGASAAERVAERRTRLIAAALDVVGERGVRDFTMTAVCRAAGLTERYFYESFARREDLLEALFESVAATALDLAVRAADGVPHRRLEARARAAIGATTTLLGEDARVARLYREAIGHPQLAGRRQDTIAAFAALLARLIAEAHPELRSEDLQLTTVVLTGGVVDAVGFWLDGRLDADVDALLTRCARLVEAAADQHRTENRATEEP